MPIGYRPGGPTTLRQDPVDDRFEFTKGFSAGIDQTQALGGGLLATLGSATGNDEMFYDGLDYYNKKMAESAENQADVGRLEDIDGADDFFSWLFYTAGNALPSLATTIAGGGIGGMAVKAGLKKKISADAEKYAADRVRNAVDTNLKDRIARDYTRNALSKAGTRGATAGAVIPSVGLSTGESFTRIMEEAGEERAGAAFATGIAAGLLDAAAPLAALKRVLPKGTYQRALDDISGKAKDEQWRITRALKEAAKIGGIEGLTEMTQEILQTNTLQLIEAEENPELMDQYFTELFSETNRSLYLNALAAGAVGGFTIGGASGLAKRTKKQTEGEASDQEVFDRATEESTKPQPAEPVGETNQRIEVARDRQKTVRSKGFLDEQLRRQIQARQQAKQILAAEEEAPPPAPRREPPPPVERTFIDTLDQDVQAQRDQEASGERLPDNTLVEYAGQQGFLQTREDGLYVVSGDQETFVEGGLSNTSPEALGVRVIPEATVQFENDVLFDPLMNLIRMGDKNYTYQSTNTNAQGETVSITGVDESGARRTFRDPEVVQRLERQIVESELQSNPMQRLIDISNLPVEVQEVVMEQAEAQQQPMPDEIAVDDAVSIAQAIDPEMAEQVQEAASVSTVMRDRNSDIYDDFKPYSSVTTTPTRGVPDALVTNKQRAESKIQNQAGDSLVVDVVADQDLNDLTNSDSRIKAHRGPDGERVSRNFNDLSDPQKRTLEKALVDVVSSGVPVQLFRDLNDVRVFNKQDANGSATVGYYDTAQNILALKTSELSNRGGKQASDLRWTITHEMSHALDEFLDKPSENDPRFRLQLADKQLAINVHKVEMGEAMNELYENFMNDTPLGRVLEYPFVTAFHGIKLNKEAGNSNDRWLKTIQREAFAQAFATYFSNPVLLRDNAPTAYDFIRESIDAYRNQGETATRESTEVPGEVSAPAPTGGIQDGDSDVRQGSEDSPVPEQASEEMGGTQSESDGLEIDLKSEYPDFDYGDLVIPPVPASNRTPYEEQFRSGDYSEVSRYDRTKLKVYHPDVTDGSYFELTHFSTGKAQYNYYPKGELKPAPPTERDFQTALDSMNRIFRNSIPSALMERRRQERQRIIEENSDPTAPPTFGAGQFSKEFSTARLSEKRKALIEQADALTFGDMEIDPSVKIRSGKDFLSYTIRKPDTNLYANITHRIDGDGYKTESNIFAGQYGLRNISSSESDLQEAINQAVDDTNLGGPPITPAVEPPKRTDIRELMSPEDLNALVSQLEIKDKRFKLDLTDPADQRKDENLFAGLRRPDKYGNPLAVSIKDRFGRLEVSSGDAFSSSIGKFEEPPTIEQLQLAVERAMDISIKGKRAKISPYDDARYVTENTVVEGSTVDDVDDGVLDIPATVTRGKPSPDLDLAELQEEKLSRPSSEVTTREKVSRTVESMRQDRKGFISEKLQGFTQGIFDDVNRIGHYERLMNDGKLFDGSESAYKAALWSKNISVVAQAAMEAGPVQLKDGGFQLVEGEEGFYKIFDGYTKEELRDWELWASANRAKRLIAEDREKLFSQQDIKTILDTASEKGLTAKYQDTLNKWIKYNRKMLDLAEQSGILDGVKRKAWDKDDYVPFFRFEDEAETNDLQNDALRIRRGLDGQVMNIRQLVGGEGKINPLESMVSQITTTLDRSFKNEAMRRMVNQMQEFPDAMVEVPASQSNLQLAMNPENNLVKVYFGGKAKVYQVKDPVLLRSIQGVGGYSLDAMSQAFSIPKKALTRGVTLDPGFMIANAFRDLLATSIQFPNAPNPVKSITKAMRYISSGVSEELTGETDSAAYLESKQSLYKIMASGGLAIGDFYGSGQAENIRNDINRINSLDTTLNTPDKLERFHDSWLDATGSSLKNVWEKWNRIGGKFEQASRINLYENAIQNGETHAEAVSQAADILNFSKRGDYKIIQFMVHSYPFFNARLQGLNVLARSITENPKHVLSRGGALAMASIALYMMNREDERYEQLPDYDKDLNFHFFLGDEHYRLPKPFELGLIFGTLPERMATYAIEEDKDMAYLMDGVRDGVMTSLSFDFFPQVVKPLVDVYSNEDSFREQRIVSRALEDAPPEMQFNQYTSDTAKAIALGMPDFLPDEFRSPIYVEYLLKGYLGTISGYGLQIMDTAVRDPDLPVKPELLPSQLPVIKRFYRTGVETSKYGGEFFELRNYADNLYREHKALVENGRTQEAQDFLNANGGYPVVRKGLSAYYKKIKQLNKRRDLIYKDRQMSAAEKTRRLNEIYAERNKLYGEAVKKYDDYL